MEETPTEIGFGDYSIRSNVPLFLVGFCFLSHVPSDKQTWPLKMAMYS